MIKVRLHIALASDMVWKELDDPDIIVVSFKKEVSE